MWSPLPWTLVLGPAERLVYSAVMTKRGIITIVVLVAGALAAILYFVLRPGEPAEPAVPEVVYVIAIDAGQGGREPGAVSRNVMGKDINLAVAKRVHELTAAEEDLNPVLIRELDILIPFDERIALAEEAGAILYVTVNTNGFDTPEPNGVETIVDDSRDYGDESFTLAELIQDAVVGATGAADRGTWQQPSYMERTEMPAVSVAIGYITHPDEKARLVDPVYQKLVAEGIFAGIRQYIDLRYPPEQEDS